MARPLAVAITGGIGAGKSEALRAFERHGAVVLSADEIVHRLLREDRELQDELHDAFGVRVRSGGEAERAALAEAVFGDPERVERLERMLHPRVAEEQLRWTAAQDAWLVVVEIPLLYEVGAESRFDAVVAITAPAELREARKQLARLPERELRMLAQEEKARRADYAYVNDGTLEELDAWVAGIVEKLRGRAAT